MSTVRFRITFSFTGEKRAFVKEVADILAQRFGSRAEASAKASCVGAAER